MKKLIGLIMIIVITLSTQVFAVSFSDLNTTHWAHASITQMTNSGIINGYPDGTFKPEKNVTRAEFSKILVKALELENRTTTNFEDVATDFWGYNDIKIASNYLSAYEMNGKNYFMPNDYAVREDVAVAVVKASGFSNLGANYDVLNQFSDKNEISVNLRDYISIAVEKGLMRGNANGTFNPKGKLTRAEAAQLILNALSIKENYKEESGIDVQLKNIKYNSKTSTIDLGENWREYGIGIEYDKKTNKYVAKYRPMTQLITITEDMSNNANCFTTDENGEKSYLTIARLDDLENYVKVECENPFKNVKYNSKNGYIDFGDDFSKFVYAISYNYKIIGNETLVETTPYNLLTIDSFRKLVSNPEMSVYTNDLGAFAGPDCYVPFIVVGLRDNIMAVKVIDTRANIEKYLRTNIETITKDIKNEKGHIELKYSFSKNIREIEVYVENEETKELLIKGNGLDIESKGKDCIIKFEVEAGNLYNVVINATFLDGIKEMLTPIVQTVSVNRKMDNIITQKEQAQEPQFKIDIMSSKIVVEDFEELRDKYEYCYSDTSAGISDLYQDFKTENDLIIKNDSALYIREKETKEKYASEPFYVKKTTGKVIGISECKESFDSNGLYREIQIKDLYPNDPNYSYTSSVISSVTGKEKYYSLIDKGQTINSNNFNIAYGDIVSMFSYGLSQTIGSEDEGGYYSSYLISNIILEEKATDEPIIQIESKNKKVTSLSEVSINVNRDKIPYSKYVIWVHLREEPYSKYIKGTTLSNTDKTVADVFDELEIEMKGRGFSVDIVVQESSSFESKEYARMIKEFYWNSER